jgi:DNA-binding transcriptional MerR regulator
MQALKVGELAKRTGLTIRTLHHYDEIGLLKPSLHTETKHRLYTSSDIARLQQVLSLRQLGFSLEEIRDCLDRASVSPLEVIKHHIARLRQQIELQRGLCERLEGLTAYFQSAGDVSADAFLRTIEVINMIENYYTPEQLAHLQQGRESAAAAGVDVVQQGQADWAALFNDLRTEMDKGTDPADPKVQALEQRRRALIRAFTGGDPGIERSLKRLWAEQGDKLCTQYGYDPRLLEYLGKVEAANTTLIP